MFLSRIFMFLLILSVFFNCDEISSVKTNTGEEISQTEAKSKNVVSDSFKDQEKYDHILYKNISILKIGLGASAKKLIERCGNPDSISKHLNEFEGTIFYHYHYGNSNFSIKNDSIDGFEIRDKKFPLDFRGITIGKDMRVLENIFPLSYKNRFTNDKGIEIVKVQIENKPDYILFFVSQGEIIEYSIWQSW